MSNPTLQQQDLREFNAFATNTQLPERMCPLQGKMIKPILSLQNHFLVAMPALTDINFSQSVIYICSHNNDSTMGIVINRPIVDINVGGVFTQMKITSENPAINQLPVYLGGPIQPERGFIIHRPNKPWQATLTTSAEMAVTSSQDILQAIATNEGPDDIIVALGYAGWDAGQLEQEISQNCWLTMPAEADIIFNTPFAMRWQAALDLLGVNASHLSGDIGHA